MRRTTSTAPDLARWLLAHEAGEGEPAEATPQAASRTFEKLRLYLTKLVGVAGFQALLARALVLAQADVAWLQAVRVAPDATLEGFEEAVRKQEAHETTQGAVALLTQLLGLLFTFIGEALTLHLLQDIWPEAALSDVNVAVEETP